MVLVSVKAHAWNEKALPLLGLKKKNVYSEHKIRVYHRGMNVLSRFFWQSAQENLIHLVQKWKIGPDGESREKVNI